MMAKNGEKNGGQPLDDLGIKNDQLINCAEKLVDQIWDKLNSDTEKMSANDLNLYSATLCNVWSLVRNMIEFLEEGYDEEVGEVGFADGLLDDDGQDDDEEEDDDEDDEDEGDSSKGSR
jgi:hypothetical protein